MKPLKIKFGSINLEKFYLAVLIRCSAQISKILIFFSEEKRGNYTLFLEFVNNKKKVFSRLDNVIILGEIQPEIQIFTPRHSAATPCHFKGFILKSVLMNTDKTTAHA